ncbi:MAG: SulP family inorganic anion transporter [Bdellovibrionota bacterium]
MSIADATTIKDTETNKVVGDLFGGLASMLVALPSAIAFGLIVYGPFGADFLAQGAMAGILGAIALGLVSPLLGGTLRLVSAPCAPAAAVLVALTTELVSQDNSAAVTPGIAVLLMTVVTVSSGFLQFLFGSLGGGKLIKYIPYPVVAGYLSGVGFLILSGQIPKLLGLPKGTPIFSGMISPDLWKWPGIAVGGAAVATMIIAPKITKVVPAAILALTSGVLAYFVLAIFIPELSSLHANNMVIGKINVPSMVDFLGAFTDRWSSINSINMANLRYVVVPAFTLAVLLSIDTLKTCVIVDALTRSRHNSNRELIGQGIGNISSSLVGGLPGAGTMGATLVNISSGGKTRLSGFFAGVFALLTLVLFGRLVAWVPVAALAGILIVVAFRMLDRNSLRLLRQRSTFFDFVVVAAVVVTAVSVNLIAAAGVGLGLAILLFLRDQIQGSVVRRKTLGSKTFSKKRRLRSEMQLLEKNGDAVAVFELQGSLFFGTTDQFFSEIEPFLEKSKYLIIDMRRIKSVDFTAAHMLEQIAAQLTENNGCLVFADLPRNLPTGQNLRRYFDQVGIVKPMTNVKIFQEIDSALEWVEDQVLTEGSGLVEQGKALLSINEIDLFDGLPMDALKLLSVCLDERHYREDEKVFNQGNEGDEIFFIRRGTIKIMLPLTDEKSHHLATFSRGDFFGDMAFLDKGIRSADAVSVGETDLYAISRKKFNDVAVKYPALPGMVFERLAHALSSRLRHTDSELRALEEA